MKPTGIMSVLSVGQDDLFTGLPGFAVDHVPTGTTITPFGTHDKCILRQLPAILAGICSGKYDLIVLPAVDLRWPHDGSSLKRGVRSLVSRGLRFGPISALVNHLLSQKATRVIVLDRYDSHEPLVDYLKCVPCARYYFKTNLREADNNRVYPSGPSGGCRFKHLPYWIAVENYQVPFRREKDIDVFFAGMVNSEHRSVAIDMVRQLEPEGYRIKIVEGHLPFAEYLSHMSRSWLTLSPQGYGYNGFRHYEAMLVGSVPLINASDPPIVNDFRDGQNCVLYSPLHADARRAIKNALSDKNRLLQIAQGLREFVIERHSMRAVGQYLLRQALDGDDGDGGHSVNGRPVTQPTHQRHSSFAFARIDTHTILPVNGEGQVRA